jgi:hypothetical protein
MNRINRTTREHFSKYAKYAERYNMETFKRRILMLVPENHLIKLYDDDQHLNNIPLYKWDGIGQLIRQAHDDKAIPTKYNPEGKGRMSDAEIVCLMKHIAIYCIIGARPVFTTRGAKDKTLQECMEATGEVSITNLAEILDLDEERVIALAEEHATHGLRFVAGTSKYLIWIEDAEVIYAIETGEGSSRPGDACPTCQPEIYITDEGRLTTDPEES